MEISWLTDTVTSDLRRMVHYTLLWGLDGMELRTVGGARDRVPQVNEAKLQRIIQDNGLTVSAIVPGMFEGDASDRATWLNEIAQLSESVRFCSRISCSRVIVSAFQARNTSGRESIVSALQRAGDIAQKGGVALCVLNETGMAVETGAALAMLLNEVAHPAVKAAWSPTAALRAGESPTDGLMALSKWVSLVRCADGVEQGGIWQPQPLGEGEVGWKKQLALLNAQGFEGPLSLEVDLDPRPKQGLRMANALIQLIRALPARSG